MFKSFDWGVLIGIIFVFLLGTMVLYSVAPDLVVHQLISFFIGLVLFFLIARTDYRAFQGPSLWLYFSSVFLLLLTFFLGRSTRGAVRWLSLGSLTFQPSEFVKPLFILSLSGLMILKDPRQAKNLFCFIFLFLVLAGLIFLQPDLGSVLVVLVIFLAILMAGGSQWLHLILMFFAGGLLLPVVWRFLADYQKERVLAFLDPQRDPLGSGYHLLQSIIAVGSGRIFGKGLGQGTQSHLRFLPEFQSDFIFAALAEELGLIGCLILLIGYFLLLWWILRVAGQTRDKYGLLIGVGVFTMIFFQVFINIGMNIGLIPITGVTLPLISSGGSSLVATLVSLGLVASIARVEKQSI